MADLMPINVLRSIPWMRFLHCLSATSLQKSHGIGINKTCRASFLVTFLREKSHCHQPRQWRASSLIHSVTVVIHDTTGLRHIHARNDNRRHPDPPFGIAPKVGKNASVTLAFLHLESLP